ncbi:hypothetical protein TorRG33x02_158170, partial [Trema orientale]
LQMANNGACSSGLSALQKTNLCSPLSTTLSSALSTKLDCTNFLMSKFWIVPVVRGYGVAKYLLGTKYRPLNF